MSDQSPPPPPGYGSGGQGWDQPPSSAGYPQPGPYGASSPNPGFAPSPSNGMGIAALVLGIIGLLLSPVIIGGLAGLIAVVLGFLARGKVKRGEANNGGVALSGIITGALAMVVAVVVVVLVVGLGAAIFQSDVFGDFSDLAECVSAAGEDQAALDACGRQFEGQLQGE